MIRIINIVGRRGLYDLPSFLLTENEVLTLKFVGLDIRLGRYVVTIRHGTETRMVYLSGAMTVDLTPEWLAINGIKPIEVSLELRDNAGTKVLIPAAKTSNDQQGYYIEPLKLEKTDKAWSMIAWLQRVDKELLDIRKNVASEMDELKAKIKTMADKLSEYESNGVPLKFED